MDYGRIIRRIKRLLALAEGNANVNESHVALLQAQRMMVDYGVHPTELSDDKELINVLTNEGTGLKRLYWYERELATIIAKNFRCKYYINSKRVEGKRQIQRRIMFMGAEHDVQLAIGMYKLVLNAIEFYTHQYIKKHGMGIRQHTQSLKNDYMSGFISGLEEKFDEQINNEEWGLVLVIPEEVKQEYNNRIKGSLSYKIPSVESTESYQDGYENGYEIDYNKSTISENTK